MGTADADPTSKAIHRNFKGALVECLLYGLHAYT